MDEETRTSDRLPPGAAPYLRIADILRGEILDGQLAIGQRIPSQAELEQRFQVSRPTVQRALTKLREQGFIDNRRGRPAEVLAWRERGSAAAPVATEEPERAFASLATHLAEAFERSHVTIDAFSLTAETLNSALTTQIQRVLRGEVRPKSLHVRLLLPSPSARLAIPRLVADPGDGRPLDRLYQLVNGQTITLRSAFNGLQDTGGDIELSIGIRTVPVTPLHKLYLINQTTALYGLYRIVERPVRLMDGEFAEIYDVLGIDATLFPYRAEPMRPETFDSRYVAEAYAWFESLWTTIAEPMTDLD